MYCKIGDKVILTAQKHCNNPEELLKQAAIGEGIEMITLVGFILGFIIIMGVCWYLDRKN